MAYALLALAGILGVFLLVMRKLLPMSEPGPAPVQKPARAVDTDDAWCQQLGRRLGVAIGRRASEGGGYLSGVEFTLRGREGSTLVTLWGLRVPLAMSFDEVLRRHRAARTYDFERLIRVEGTALDRAVYFTPELREALRELALDRSVLALSGEGDALRFELSGADASVVAGQIRQVVTRLGPLFRRVDEHARLLALFAEEDSPELRLGALHRLVELRDAELPTLLEQAARSDLPALRAYAALHLLDAPALAAAAREGGIEAPEVLEGMRSALGKVQRESRRSARREIGLILLGAELPAARALGAEQLVSACERDDRMVERALLDALDTADTPLAATLVDALSEVGGLASVPALVGLASHPGRLGASAQAALRAVRASLAGAEAGTIQLVEERPDEGAIQISTQGGDLSLVEEAPPRPRPAPQRQG